MFFFLDFERKRVVEDPATNHDTVDTVFLDEFKPVLAIVDIPVDRQ